MNTLYIRYLNECIVFSIKNLVKNLISKRSSIHSQYELETFTRKHEIKKDKIFDIFLFLIVPSGYFNAKLDHWYKNEKKP